MAVNTSNMNNCFLTNLSNCKLVGRHSAINKWFVSVVIERSDEKVTDNEVAGLHRHLMDFCGSGS